MKENHSTLGLACLILALLLAGMYILATPARSQEAPCAPRDALEKRIAQLGDARVALEEQLGAANLRSGGAGLKETVLDMVLPTPEEIRARLDNVNSE